MSPLPLLCVWPRPFSALPETRESHDFHVIQQAPPPRRHLLRNRIRASCRIYRAHPPARKRRAVTSSYDETLTAKALLDQGAITPEEFDAKRARLLAGDEPDDDEAPCRHRRRKGFEERGSHRPPSSSLSSRHSSSPQPSCQAASDCRDESPHHPPARPRPSAPPQGERHGEPPAARRVPRRGVG